MFIFVKKINGELRYFETNELVFTVEESTILKKITSIKFDAKLKDKFGHGSYNGTLLLQNAQGTSSVTEILLQVDAWFGKWSQWSHCSVSCIDELQPILGNFFLPYLL